MRPRCPCGAIHSTAVLLWAFAIALVVRLVHMNQPMRNDEVAMFLLWGSQSLGRVVSDYSFPNNHVFHTLLVWLTTGALGDAPWAIRLPTVVAGTLVVWATYAVARRLAGASAALFAAALTAGLPVLVLFSTNARGYMVIALAALVLLLLGDTLINENSPKRWILYAVVVGLGMYTVPTMLYPAGGVSLWILGGARTRAWRARGTADCAMARRGRRRSGIARSSGLLTNHRDVGARTVVAESLGHAADAATIHRGHAGIHAARARGLGVGTGAP